MSDCAMVLCGVVVHCFLYICLLTKFLSYAETADERFIRLLGQTDINIEAHVLANIHETGELSSRMVAASTPDHAMSVYMDAERVPQSHTRAEVLMNSNIRLDGPVPMHGVLKAMFIYAFEENVPLILKVPNLADSARKECALFAQLSDGVKSNGRDVSDYALVPVKLLKLRGEHTATRVSPLKTFNCGILMPIYCMSLDKVPVPIPPQYALQEGERLLEAIQTIHSFGCPMTAGCGSGITAHPVRKVLSTLFLGGPCDINAMSYILLQTTRRILTLWGYYFLFWIDWV